MEVSVAHKSVIQSGNDSIESENSKGQNQAFFAEPLSDVENSLNQLQEVLEGHFFKMDLEAKPFHGYQRTYAFELRIQSTVRPKVGAAVQLLGPFRFILHVTDNPRRKAMITTSPDGLIPFHPQFQNQMIRGLERGVWKDPLEHAKGEAISDMLFRFANILVYMPIGKWIQPKDYRVSNRRAWIWYQENQKNCPTQRLNVDIEKLKKMGRPDWISEDTLKVNGSSFSERKISTEVSEASVSCSQSFVDPVSESYVPKAVEWTQKPIKKNKRSRTNCNKGNGELYFTGKSHEYFEKNARAREFAVVGLFQGHVFKTSNGFAGWISKVHQHHKQAKNELQIDECLSSTYNHIKSDIEFDKPLIGWYVVLKDYAGEGIPNRIKNLHRECFSREWQYLVICKKNSDQWWVYQGRDLKLCNGDVFQDDKPSLPKEKEKSTWKAMMKSAGNKIKSLVS